MNTIKYHCRRFKDFTPEGLVDFAAQAGVGEWYRGKMARAIPDNLETVGPLHIVHLSSVTDIPTARVTGSVWSTCGKAHSQVQMEESVQQHQFLIAVQVRIQPWNDSEEDSWVYLLVIPETKGDAPPLVLTVQALFHTTDD